MLGVQISSAPPIYFSPKGDGIYLKYGYPFNGVLAQLVERLNGIEKVRSSNLLGSTRFCGRRIGVFLNGLGASAAPPVK